MTLLYPIGGVNSESEMIKDNAISLNTDGNAKGKRCILSTTIIATNLI
jgi:hypothetical protein